MFDFDSIIFTDFTSFRRWIGYFYNGFFKIFKQGVNYSSDFVFFRIRTWYQLNQQAYWKVYTWLKNLFCLGLQCKLYTLPAPPKFQISSFSITCWPCNPQVLTYNHIRAFSIFVILVFFNWSIVLWKSSISISEFCFSWPSYPSKIANSNATTNGISARSIPWRMSKNRRTTLSSGFITIPYFWSEKVTSDDELLVRNPSYNETLSNRIEYFSRRRIDRVLF